ncbi:MAG: recombinase RecT [Candidatus Paceibacterota bacterium]|jgi:recombination protein RecT
MTDNNQNGKAITPYTQLKALALENTETLERFANAFGGNKQRARSFLSSVLTVVRMDSALQECRPSDVLNECMRAAVLGLPINKELGLSCIIAYDETQKDGSKKKTPHFQIMKQGYIELAHSTKEYLIIHTGAIYANQDHRINQVTGVLEIFGDPDIEQPITHYFNYFKMKNGFESSLCMSIEELDDHGKKYSKSFFNKAGLWQKDPPVMYAKTVTKLNIKRNGKLIKDNDTAKLAAIKDDDEYLDPSDAEPQQFDDQRSELPIEPATGEVIDGQFTDAETTEPEPVTEQPPAPVETTPKSKKAKSETDPRVAALLSANVVPDETEAAAVLAKININANVPIEEVVKIARGFKGWKDMGASDKQAIDALNDGKYPK